VRVERFFSPALGVEKHYVVYLPPSYATAPARRYPVAYYLHGLTGNESDWVSLAGIDVIADSLMAGGMSEMILVMPDGDDGVLSPLYAGPHPFAAPARYHTSVDSLAADWRGTWGAIAPAFGRTIASWTARDPAQLVRRLAAARGPMPALFIDVGTRDRLADQARAFHAELAALGISHAYAEWPGKHDWKYWHAHVGESLRWLAARIAR